MAAHDQHTRASPQPPSPRSAPRTGRANILPPGGSATQSVRARWTRSRRTSSTSSPQTCDASGENCIADSPPQYANQALASQAAPEDLRRAASTHCKPHDNDIRAHETEAQAEETAKAAPDAIVVR